MSQDVKIRAPNALLGHAVRKNPSHPSDTDYIELNQNQLSVLDPLNSLQMQNILHFFFYLNAESNFFFCSLLICNCSQILFFFSNPLQLLLSLSGLLICLYIVWQFLILSVEQAQVIMLPELLKAVHKTNELRGLERVMRHMR